MNTFPLTRAALVRPAIASALLVSAVFALCLTAAGAGAQTQPQASTNSSQAGAGDVAVKPGQTGGAGRYVMTPAANGFLRLDTSGAVSLCVVKNDKVTCQSSADERAALEAEIARLAGKNAELEKKLAEASKSTAQRLRDVLPSDKEMDKALTYAEKFMRRMMRIMREEDKKPPQDRI